MQARVERRWAAFTVTAVIVAIVAIAVFRLPESLISQLERNAPLSSDAAGWAFRLLVIAALAQAAYGGFSVLQVDRIREARTTDPKIHRMTRSELFALLARNAGGMVLLTLAYGIAAIIVSGERGGFLAFVLIALAQLGWYLRQVSQIGSYLDFQADPSSQPAPAPWNRPGPDYVPPLVRGLRSAPPAPKPD